MESNIRSAARYFAYASKFNAYCGGRARVLSGRLPKLSQCLVQDVAGLAELRRTLGVGSNAKHGPAESGAIGYLLIVYFLLPGSQGYLGPTFRPLFGFGGFHLFTGVPPAVSLLAEDPRPALKALILFIVDLHCSLDSSISLHHILVHQGCVAFLCPREEVDLLQSGIDLQVLVVLTALSVPAVHQFLVAAQHPNELPGGRQPRTQRTQRRQCFDLGVYHHQRNHRLDPLHFFHQTLPVILENRAEEPAGVDWVVLQHVVDKLVEPCQELRRRAFAWMAGLLVEFGQPKPKPNEKTTLGLQLTFSDCHLSRAECAGAVSPVNPPQRSAVCVPREQSEAPAASNCGPAALFFS